MLTLNDGRSELWQWDTCRTLAVDADCSQVHFSNKVFGRSLDVDVIGGVANIPDILLQTDKDLTAWAFVGTPENGYTKISKVFKVNRRNKPADYVFTPTEQTTLGEILERLDDIESAQDPDAIKNAVEDYLDNNPIQIEETDPTVPAWAKAPEKPSYTAEEVGALPVGTEIPTVPTTLPNPHKLTFSGAVEAEYDGSEAVEVVIPQGGGGSGGGEVLWSYTVGETVAVTQNSFAPNIDVSSVQAFSIRGKFLGASTAEKPCTFYINGTEALKKDTSSVNIPYFTRLAGSWTEFEFLFWGIGNSKTCVIGGFNSPYKTDNTDFVYTNTGSDAGAVESILRTFGFKCSDVDVQFAIAAGSTVEIVRWI